MEEAKAFVFDAAKRLHEGFGREQVENFLLKKVRFEEPEERVGPKKLRKDFDTELKFFDTYLENESLLNGSWAGGSLLRLSSVGEGTGNSERNGNVFSIESVVVRGRLDLASYASPTDIEAFKTVHCKVALVLDTQTNLQGLNGTDIFEDTQDGREYGFRNPLFTKRFRILASKTLKLNDCCGVPTVWGNTVGLIEVGEGSTSTTAVRQYARARSTKDFEFAVDFKKPLEVHMNGPTGHLSYVVDNSLQIIAFQTDKNELPGGLPVYMDCVGRIRFRG